MLRRWCRQTQPGSRQLYTTMQVRYKTHPILFDPMNLALFEIWLFIFNAHVQSVQPKITRGLIYLIAVCYILQRMSYFQSRHGLAGIYGTQTHSRSKSRESMHKVRGICADVRLVQQIEDPGHELGSAMQEGGTLDSDNHSSLPPVTPKSASSLGPVFIVNILAKGYVSNLELFALLGRYQRSCYKAIFNLLYTSGLTLIALKAE